MTCRFSNLTFGEKYHLSGGQSCCQNCGADTEEQLESTEWFYQGHSDGADIFAAVTPFNCHSCGEKTFWLAETCDDGQPVMIMQNKEQAEK